MDAQPNGRRPENPGEAAAHMSLDTAKELTNQAGDRLLGGVSKATRFVLRRIPGIPGFIYDATKVLTSDEPLREATGIAGGALGGAGGGLLGAAAGGVNAPLGAVLGAAGGENVAHDVYDDYYRQHKAQMDATNRWIVQRRKDLFGR